MHKNIDVLNRADLLNQIKTKLTLNLDKLKEQFNSNNPSTSTKFFILDNLLDADTALILFNTVNSDRVGINWKKKNTFREKKSGFKNIKASHINLINIFESFHDSEIAKIISEITNIDNLRHDSSLYAAGISKMEKNDFLNPHIDNSHDGSRKFYRRLNLLFYIDPNITSIDGGNLELWDNNVKNSIKLYPKFNRLIIMETNRSSWHSVDSIKSENKQRLCITNYFFSKESPEEYEYYNVTSFLGRPEQKMIRVISKLDNFLRQTFSDIRRFSR